MSNIVLIIPTYGRNSLLERTLLSLSECHFPASYTKTIVIENGPKEQAEQVCKKFTNIKCEYQYTEIANKSSALNQVISSLQENTFIIFLDDDIRLSKDFLTSYAKAFEDSGDGFIYGGPLDIDYEKEPAKYYKTFLPMSAKGWKLKEGEDYKIFNIFGCNWAVSLNKLNLVGGFNPRFGPNSTTGATGQEHQVMFKLQDLGLDLCYVKEAKVWHYVPKERATIKFCLMRKYKGGISTGLLEPSKYSKTLLSFKIYKNVLSMIIYAILFSRSKFITKLFDSFHIAGIIKGLRLSKSTNA
ncbi:glycosyltransferase family 2 protein [Pontibacter qinzhouensis]|uniref:Glycosyltransferase family 2 protein n=1 Tax=Pontibacter qinzhouensis TaxID=2603253 RepID=A0A5C8KAY7_9BACT|nr:glycosyltransferase family A protein [Pontibacter qinzhouensis]TXK46964.1 glycosyltransferase family 2 protein [Pontibacter qinzhouensis]